jgi:hypothetical protein
MSYFEDLSDYAYSRSEFNRLGTKNVGWLDTAHEFPIGTPTEDLLDLVWDYCKVSIAQTRGIHECQRCPSGTSHFVERNGQHLLLGSAEIRVFAKGGVIYAAPTLVYHYISVHHYAPPDEFVRALGDGPRPPSQEYFDRLEELGLEWNETSAPDTKPRRFRSVRLRDGQTERIDLP